MNKKILNITILFILGLNYCCISNKTLKTKSVNNKIYSEKQAHITVFNFLDTIDTILYYDKNNKLVNNKHVICAVEGMPLVNGFNGVKHWFSFVKKKDTMEIIFFSDNRTNYLFDNIKFKQGHYKLHYQNNRTQIKTGKDIYSNNKTLLDTKVIYKPYNNFKGKTVELKNIEFEYYDFKQKDFTLEKIKD